jgi:hypothetical protein
MVHYPSSHANSIMSECLQMRKGNEEEVGRAIRDSGIPRSEIFVTTTLLVFLGIPSLL